MDYEKLKAKVDEVRGFTFASIDTETNVTLKGGKKNPLQGRVKKITKNANVMLFAGTDQSGYANMIKKRMMEEGKDPEAFTLGPRAWGTRISQSPFIEHNGKHYLECIFVHPGKSVYLVDGVETPKDQIEGLEDTKPAVNEESQGGIENKIVLRTFSLDSITAARLKGVELV